MEEVGKDLDDHEVDCSFCTVLCMLDDNLAQQHQVVKVMKREDGWKTCSIRVSPQDLQKVKNSTDRARVFCPGAFQLVDGGGKVYICYAVKNKTMFNWLTLVFSPSRAKSCLSTFRLSNPATSYYNEVQCPMASLDTPPS